MAGNTATITLVQTAGFGGGSAAARANVFSPSGVFVGAFSANASPAFLLTETGSHLIQVVSGTLTTTGTYNVGVDCS